MLGDLADMYVRAFNTGKVPDIKDGWTYICECGCAEAVKKSLEYLRNLLAEIKPFPCQDAERFQKELQDAKQKSTILFEKECNNLEKGNSLATIEVEFPRILNSKSNDNANALDKIKIDALTEA